MYMHFPQLSLYYNPNSVHHSKQRHECCCVCAVYSKAINIFIGIFFPSKSILFGICPASKPQIQLAIIPGYNFFISFLFFFFLHCAFKIKFINKIFYKPTIIKKVLSIILIISSSWERTLSIITFLRCKKFKKISVTDKHCGIFYFVLYNKKKKNFLMTYIKIFFCEYHP